MIHALEEAAIEQHDAELQRQLLTFVVAGGGFSGVEVVAELNDFVHRVSRRYRGIDPSNVRVLLLHSQERILPEMDESLALFAQKLLARRGVEVRLGTRLEAATPWTLDLILPKQEYAALAAHLPDLRASFERLTKERTAAPCRV